MDVGASAPDSALRGPEDTSCFFLGGALTDYQISQCSSDQDRAIKTKVQGKVEDDILHMLRFVTENMVRSDNPVSTNTMLCLHPYRTLHFCLVVDLLLFSRTMYLRVVPDHRYPDCFHLAMTCTKHNH